MTPGKRTTLVVKRIVVSMPKEEFDAMPEAQLEELRHRLEEELELNLEAVVEMMNDKEPLAEAEVRES